MRRLVSEPGTLHGGSGGSSCGGFDVKFTVIGVDGGVDDCGCGVEEASVGSGWLDWGKLER